MGPMSTRILRYPSGLVVSTGWDPDLGCFYYSEGQDEASPQPSLDALMARIAAAGTTPSPALRTALHADQLCQSRTLTVEYELGS